MARRPPAVARVLERVTATARKHEMFSQGDRVLVAVSGGPDSTCLLHSLHMLRRLFKIELEVFHFDHRLRPDSAKDAQYVKRMAGKLKLPFHLRAAETKPHKGQSVEEWARLRRFEAAQTVAHQVEASRIALGHTLDDQAETVLIQLIRGGGLAALSGIRPLNGPLVRPLLAVRRSEVETFCRVLRLRPRTDPTNADPRLLRNAVRLRVLPAMEKATGRDVKGPIARSASLLRSEYKRLSPVMESGYMKLGSADPPGQGRMETAVFADLDNGRRADLVKRFLHHFMDPPVERAHVEAVLDLIGGRPGRKRNLPGGLIAVREKEYVRLSRTSPGSGGGRGKGGV